MSRVRENAVEMAAEGEDGEEMGLREYVSWGRENGQRRALA